MTNSPLYNFTKKEKLKSRKLIELLFKKGNSFLVFPVKVIYILVDETIDNPIKIGVSASSKKFKNAVDRNRIKRLLKENYRLHKQPLHDFILNSNTQVGIFLMYIDKAIPSDNLIERKMPIIIDKLIMAIGEKNTKAL